MLNTHLSSQPYTKLILIQDSLANNAKKFLKYFLKLHTANIHYFMFEGNFLFSKQPLHLQRVHCHDFVSDLEGWFKDENVLATVLQDIHLNGSIILIDSLVHAINQYGLSAVYNLLHTLKLNKGIQRIVTIFHKDLIQDADETFKYLEHLATISIVLIPYKMNNNLCLTYTYKKSGGKIIKKTEEYTILNDDLKCMPIKKVDLNAIQQSTDSDSMDNLTTFRLSLNDKEKEARSKVILPYLPKSEPTHINMKGDISYEFDETDDWDEEDPDDDLDI